MIEGWKDLAMRWNHCCSPEIPTVFGEEWSYYERVCKLIKYLDDTMYDVTLLEKEIENINNKIVDTVKGELPDLLKEFIATGILNLTLNGFVTPQLFGAKGDGVTDDTLAIKTMVETLCAKGGGLVILPKGIYCISDTITIKCCISIIGSGSDRSNLDIETPMTKFGSGFKWIGRTKAPMFNFDGELGGLTWQSLCLDGGNVATTGFNFDRIRSSLFQNVVIFNCSQYGMRFYPIANSDNDNAMNNLFQRIHIRGSQTGILIDGSANANTCFNVFESINIDYNGIGCRILNGDNNTFYHLNGFSRGGSYTLSLESSLARSNYFIHFSGNVRAINGSSNAILFFDRDNSNVPPEIDNLSNLFYNASCNNALGWHFDSPQFNIKSVRTGSFSLPIVDIDKDIIQVTAPEYGNGGVMTPFSPGNYRGVALSAANMGQKCSVPSVFFGTNGLYCLSFAGVNNDIVQFYSASKPDDNVFLPWRDHWSAGDIAWNIDVPNDNSPIGWRFNGTTWKTMSLTIS